MEFNTKQIYRTFAEYFCQDGLQLWITYLMEKLDAGNVCLDINAALEKDERLKTKVLYSHELVGTEDDNKPFIVFNERLYLHRFFHYEKTLALQISKLCSNHDIDGRKLRLQAQKDLINHILFPPNVSLTTTDWQQVACLNAFLNNFNIISGGPGTGKTTTVSKLLVLLLMDNPDCKVSLCAPTGKAAARMQESISNAMVSLKDLDIPEDIIHKISLLQATTIHSLLGYIHGSIAFRHNNNNLLKTDVLIVDECSMIDLSLFYKLLQAVDTTSTKVILLGDKNQLASVDAGSIFRDLCNETMEMNTFSSERLEFINDFIELPQNKIKQGNLKARNNHPLFQHLIELEKSFRFKDDDGIGVFSKAILNNNTEVIQQFLNKSNDQIEIFNTTEFDHILKEASQQFTSNNNGYIGLNSIEDILHKINHFVVLCAVKEGKYGVVAINNLIEKLLFNPSFMYYNYQLIMVTQNQPENNVYNGDMGIVFDVDGNKDVYFAKSKTENFKLSPAQILSWQTAFAMTIHKSQGSEFDEVLIVLPDTKENQLLTRELLYTAITRAKHIVKIIGNADMIYKIAQQSVSRISGLAFHFSN